MMEPRPASSLELLAAPLPAASGPLLAGPLLAAAFLLRIAYTPYTYTRVILKGHY